MSETQLVRSILDALAIHGIWAWRTNSGTFKVGDHRVKGAPAGTPDILGALPDGRMFGIEAKTRSGKLRQSQVAWIARAAQSNVKVAVVTSVSEAVDTVKGWLK